MHWDIENKNNHEIIMTESLLLTSLFHFGIYLKIAITKGRVCAGRVISYGEKDKFKRPGGNF